MPCNSDYMEPTTREKQLRETNLLLIYAYACLDKIAPREVHDAARSMYGGRPESVADLCELLSGMTEEQLNEHVYNGRDSTARRLANWWDLHQEADRQREAEKTAKEQQEAVKARALTKLTEEEREALGL